VPKSKLSIELLHRGLSGEPRALRELIEAMSPIIHVHVVRLLLRVGASQGRDGRQEVEDFVQEVLSRLFSNGGQPLRRWDPQRGLSLENFVGLLADHEVLSILRSRRRNPWTDQPEEEPDIPDSGKQSPERLLASKELLGLVLDRTTARLTTELSRLMFQLVIVEERSVEEICAIAEMKPDQVYNWKSRLVDLLWKAAKDVLGE
jgi:RNA polymerase sigma-70 factor (ECF subfamily)